jgi:hypothetical protein
MAIDYENYSKIPEFEGRVDTFIEDANYQFGSPKNSPTIGTPYIAKRSKDFVGFQQAALLAAGMTPSGDPDTALSSQVYDALKQRFIDKGTSNDQARNNLENDGRFWSSSTPLVEDVRLSSQEITTYVNELGLLMNTAISGGGVMNGMSSNQDSVSKDRRFRFFFKRVQTLKSGIWYTVV